MDIKNNLAFIKSQIQKFAHAVNRKAEEITLVVVSKQQPLEKILGIYNEGIRDFGESRLQELLIKKDKLPQDIRWHFIGRIQHNKIGKIVEAAHLIHSVADAITAQRISEASVEQNKKSSILLQANTSGEAAKSGLGPNDWQACFAELLFLKGIIVNGLMTMAPHIDDKEKIRKCFRELRNLREELQRKNPEVNLSILSMGMSHDFPLAIEEGSTLLRIGSAIFL